ncbi:serine/threonine-protein kinase [Cellulomonas soli]
MSARRSTGPTGSTGSTVLGRYVLEDVIGAGGSADVHRARDLHLGTVVAVKVHRERQPSARTDADPGAGTGVGGGAGAGVGTGAVLGALREVAALEHPHLVRVLDLGLDATGRPCVVMPLVEGPTLETHLAAAGPLTCVDALALTDAVLAGLQHAHEHGFVHLDLSPTNVVLPDSGRRPGPAGAVVLDLTGQPPPRAGSAWVHVSPSYAAPEIARAGDVDARADLYAAGCLLVHALLGRPPFEAADPAAVLTAHVHTAPPVPSHHTDGIPAHVDALVARALAKDPDARFATAAAMRNAVQDAMVAAAALAPVDGSVRTPHDGGARGATPGTAPPPAGSRTRRAAGRVGCVGCTRCTRCDRWSQAAGRGTARRLARAPGAARRRCRPRGEPGRAQPGADGGGEPGRDPGRRRRARRAAHARPRDADPDRAGADRARPRRAPARGRA